MLFRALLSAITLFGGHVLNRRLDRILQIGGLLALLGIVYSVLPSLLLRDSAFYEMTEAFHASALILLGIGLLSAVLTSKDFKSLPPPALSPSSRLAGGVISLFGLILIGLATLVLLSAIGTRTIHVNRSSEPRSQLSSRPTYAIANLGGRISYDELRHAPVGPHPLRGRIVTAGQPVAAAEVELTLNGTFRSEVLVTNEQGEFEIFLPAGPWSLNNVYVRSWNNVPEGAQMLLFSEHEPLRDSGYYTRRPPDESPVRIDLPMRAGAELPTFELRPSIALQWPPLGSGDPSDSSTAPVANAATDSIRWSPVPGAMEYEIQLQSVERRKATTRVQALLVRRQSDTRLPLATLPQQPRESTEPSEYSVVVYAFDAHGKLLSQSLQGFDYVFRLDGETQLAKEQLASSISPDDESQYMRNVGRLSLVNSLLEYKQLDAARAILKEVGDAAPPGRKAAMQGAIEALAGNCAAAIPLFDRADKEGGLGCVPSKYRAMCPPNSR